MFKNCLSISSFYLLSILQPFYLVYLVLRVNSFLSHLRMFSFDLSVDYSGLAACENSGLRSILSTISHRLCLCQLPWFGSPSDDDHWLLADEQDRADSRRCALDVGQALRCFVFLDRIDHVSIDQQYGFWQAEHDQWPWSEFQPGRNRATDVQWSLA